MTNKLKQYLGASLTLHVGLVLCLGFFLWETQQSKPTGFVEVMLVGSQGGAKPQSVSLPKKSKSKAIMSAPAPSQSSGSGDASNQQARPGAAGDSTLLAEIRQKIERAKIYPRAAINQGMTGQVKMVFNLSEAGQPINVSLIKSSGYDLLDQATRQAILRAAPYPYYGGLITSTMQFSLNDD